MNIFEQYNEKIKAHEELIRQREAFNKEASDFRGGLEAVVYTEQLDYYLGAQGKVNKATEDLAKLDGELQDLKGQLLQFFADHPRVTEVRMLQGENKATIALQYDPQNKDIIRYNTH